jgi:hypothetical protein
MQPLYRRSGEWVEAAMTIGPPQPPALVSLGKIAVNQAVREELQKPAPQRTLRFPLWVLLGGPTAPMGDAPATSLLPASTVRRPSAGEGISLSCHCSEGGTP